MKRLLCLAILAVGCAASPARPPIAAATECAALKPMVVTELVSQWKTENHKFAFTRTAGAEVLVAAEPGQSRELLERAARCRIQQPDVAIGHADVKVLSVDGGYAIQLTSSDPALAKDILARASKI
jgi:hypothetical protein